MRSKCGSTVEISDNYNMEIGDYWMRKRNRDYLELYYAGQEVVRMILTFIKHINSG